jgi:glutamine amidotransferase
MKVGVINYGVGNVGSVFQAFQQLRAAPVLIDKAADMRSADALILPGVGGFSDCKRLLDQGGWSEAICDQVRAHQKPILGICLGMQLLADSGEEGAEDGGLTPGLGLIPGTVRSLKSLGCHDRVPHVGWNAVEPLQDHAAMKGIASGTDFYFVHSYAFVPELETDKIAICNYGIAVTAIVARNKVWGAQFHPEKSSRAGLQLLKNFVEGQQC